jgi:hypothetical protein
MKQKLNHLREPVNRRRPGRVHSIGSVLAKKWVNEMVLLVSCFVIMVLSGNAVNEVFTMTKSCSI